MKFFITDNKIEDVEEFITAEVSVVNKNREQGFLEDWKLLVKTYAKDSCVFKRKRRDLVMDFLSSLENVEKGLADFVSKKCLITTSSKMTVSFLVCLFKGTVITHRGELFPSKFEGTRETTTASTCTNHSIIHLILKWKQ